EAARRERRDYSVCVCEEGRGRETKESKHRRSLCLQSGQEEKQTPRAEAPPHLLVGEAGRPTKKGAASLVAVSSVADSLERANG
ncbi:unnamed protein product, partial [Ectocarpus sp. 12 AP-2014]